MAVKKTTKSKTVAKQTTKSKAPAAPVQAPAEKKQYDNTNRGVLFPNDKDGNDSRPDYTGKINIDGTEKRLAAWVTESTTGNVSQFLKLVVSEFQARE
jgi:hypothetical protein